LPSQHSAPLKCGIATPSFEAVEDVADERVRVGFFRVGDVQLELLEPSDPSSTIAAFLDKRGEGLHHIAYTVDDLESRSRSSSSRACG
jgi:4-hydroxyphenylpyruvate dioxygenase-like putative hemolysin